VEKLGDHKPADGWRGGKYSIFEGGTRVPFLVRWPARIPRPMDSPALISQIDLLHTLAFLTGARLEEGAGPDSFNLISALLGADKQGRPHLVEQAGSLSVIVGRWKYVAPSKGARFNQNTNTELGNDPQPQLYDLEEDPGERNNVAERFPDKVEELAALLERIRQTPRTRPGSNGL